MKKKLIFVLVCMLVFSTVAGAISSSKTSNESSDEMTIGRDPHTVLAEFGTSTTCPYCPSHENYLKQVVGDWELVSLPCSNNHYTYGYNSAIVARLAELGMGGFPTSFWDGGYTSVVGGQSSVTNLQNAYNTCAARSVADVDLGLVVTWLGSAQIKIDVDVTNNEGSTYNGHIHAYILEITSRWLNYNGQPYPNALLDLVFNQDINVVSSGTWSDTITWYGASHGYGDIVQDNILIVASVFSQSNDYVDETTSIRVGNNRPPYTPSNPSPGNGGSNIIVEASLSWTGGDPDWFNSVSYDVYFGTSSPPPLIVGNQSETTYNPPGLLDFDETYYWKIVSWDDEGASTSGPQWSFTTRGNDPPNTPSNPSPTNGETDVNINADLSWTGGDPDGDPVTYDVYFGTSSPPQQVVSNQSGTIYNLGILEFDKTYYWKIVSWDKYDFTSEGSIWSFTTEENEPPNMPSDPDPGDGEIDVNAEADLSWTGGDPNPGDTVTYDVYFGKTSPPPLVVNNQSGASYNPGTMDLNTTYYWQIVSWDSQEESTSGPIWHFTITIAPNAPPNKPSIAGSPSGKAGVEYEYTVSAVDPNEDNVKYFIDWDDGNTEWTDYYDSGEEVTIGHTWDNTGTYTIRVKAKDTHGEESEWETLVVEMPLNKHFHIHPILQKILELFPNAFPILRHLLGL